MKSLAPPKRIFVVDDHPLIREGLAAQFAGNPNLQICGEAEDIPDAMARVFEAKPDLVIVDVSLKSSNGVELVKRFIAKNCSLVILVWSMHPENLYAERALRAGARGYINKGKGASEIVEAILTVLDGGVHLSSEMSARLLGRVVGGGRMETGASGISSLTDRELDTFELMGHGLTTLQIASRMHCRDLPCAHQGEAWAGQCRGVYSAFRGMGGGQIEQIGQGKSSTLSALLVSRSFRSE
jgi:DNA-binding NarL/FixJ family response regulator